MGALELENLTWPEVRDEIAAGRDTVVVAFGAVEQHGHHLPLGTDSFFGDELSRRLAERLDAFRAPTIPIGCSRHHLAFPGTMSIEEETFHGIVGDLVRGWARHGFRRIVILPTHGGNFAPLSAALEKLGPLEGVVVIGISDLGMLIQATLGTGAELGVPASEGGIHGGQWETSMMLALRPELVRMDRAVPGYTGDLEAGIERFLAEGVDALTDTGVVGDPRNASAEHGRIYTERLLDLAAEVVESSSAQRPLSG
jgi:creatinine amidohydrolase/Fe(II)-dependent formamide hydrolase-like protein